MLLRATARGAATERREERKDPQAGTSGEERWVFGGVLSSILVSFSSEGLKGEKSES